MSACKLYGPGDLKREVDEPVANQNYRSAYRRDYARLLHSPTFRRLQGKTQLFPGFESDFFRNRLTHSLEVAQIAKSISLRLNSETPELKNDPIDVDIVELAGLAHDLGHPPFGHNGEAALDACMRQYGGFEGNAQTLRIVSRLEKKRFGVDADGDSKRVGVSAGGVDYRVGLNWCARSLAAVLKYDKQIPVVRDAGEPLVKGYYESERQLVERVRERILPDSADRNRSLKTIECQIMDLADDIAYSTYDLEDAFKAGFLTPLGLLSIEEPLRVQVAERVSSKGSTPVTARDVLEVLLEIFSDLSGPTDNPIFVYGQSVDAAANGYIRTGLTAELVNEAVNAVTIEYDSKCPVASLVQLEDGVRRRVEILKHLTYGAVILSPRLKVAEYRGVEIVTAIFNALANDAGYLLLPSDFQELYRRMSGDAVNRHRVICDFIAGMTDAYAIEFYARLKSENARTIFKPF